MFTRETLSISTEIQAHGPTFGNKSTERNKLNNFSSKNFHKLLTGEFF